MVGPVGESTEMLMPGFLVRDMSEADRAEVLALTANTWDFGDYIKWVFDDWLNDDRGRFLAVEHVESGKLAAIDKMTFLSPDEAWFEGLRIAPDFRGHGLASRLQKYMIEQARWAGIRTVRLLTSTSNLAVQHMAYRDGFVLKGVFAFWNWTIEYALPPDSKVRPMRKATDGEAEGLYSCWVSGSAYRTAGLCHRNWSFSETNAGEWQRAAVAGNLLVLGDEVLEARLPPAAVLLAPEMREDGGARWIVTALSVQATEWTVLLAALTASAQDEGVVEVNGLFARDPVAESALRSAEFAEEDEGEALCLFELKL